MADSSPPLGVEQEPRELHCEDCNRDYAVWCAPNELWNAVVRVPSDASAVTEPYLCPTCFTLRAEKRGVVPTAWVVRPEGYADRPHPHAKSEMQRGRDAELFDVVNRLRDRARAYSGRAQNALYEEAARLELEPWGHRPASAKGER